MLRIWLRNCIGYAPTQLLCYFGLEKHYYFVCDFSVLLVVSMAGLQRTPPKTPKTPIGNISQTQTRSEPDITSALSTCDFVNIQRSKRPRNDTSPQTILAEMTCQEPQDLQDILAKWKKEQDVAIADLLAGQKTLIAELCSDIRDIKNQNNKIQLSNSEICKSNAAIAESIEFLNRQFEDLKGEVDTLRKEHREQQRYIVTLEQKIIDLQYKSRSSGIELRNIPQRSTESSTNLIKTVCNLGTTVGLHIEEKELRDIYRLPRKSTSPNTPRPIIAEFCTVQTKQSLLSAVRLFNKGKGKDDKLNTSVMGIPGDCQPVYISEHLPATIKKLFYQARDYANRKSFKFCWISNGNIFLRKKEGDKQILVSSEKSLSLLESEDHTV